MSQKIRICLMFNGKAEEAMRFYTSVFKEAEINDIVYFDDTTDLDERNVMHGILTIKGQEIMFMDNIEKDNFEFSPSLSIFVNCENEEEIDQLFINLSKEGEILIPLETYDYSRKHGWVQDKFKVVWQLNLE